MSARESDRVQQKLRHCLHRIDEQVRQLSQPGHEPPADAADQLEAATARLQELVAAVVTAAEAGRVEHAVLAPIVERCVQSLLAEVGFPLVVRRRLATALPLLACPPDQLAGAVQRALALAAAHAGPGGELLLTSRSAGDQVLLELSCAGEARAGDPNLGERALTLRAFAAAMHGHCRLDLDGSGRLLLALAMPAALELDGR